MNNDIENRALAAYFRSASRNGGTVAQPGKPDSLTVNDKGYVVLSNVNGILAVYRVRTDGILKKLTRWPAAISARIAGATP